MDIQRLRNLTTGRLHTEMGHIYEDLAYIIGDDGIMTHMIPRVARAIAPWLREQVRDERFWDGEFDTTHTGEYPLRAMNPEERKAAFGRYKAMPNPLEGKEVVVVEVSSTTQSTPKRITPTEREMSDTRPICDFFIDRNGIEYIAVVYTSDEGFAEDYGVYELLEDGTKGESFETEPFDDEVQRKFRDWIESAFDDGRDSYPASHY